MSIDINSTLRGGGTTCVDKVAPLLLHMDTCSHICVDIDLSMKRIIDYDVKLENKFHYGTYVFDKKIMTFKAYKNFLKCEYWLSHTG